MENASKAILLAGGILIGMLVISIGVYLFINYREIGTTYENNLSATEIEKFNNNFLKFEGRENITIQEIVTVINFAIQYEEQNEIHIKITVSGVGTNDIVNWIKNLGTADSKNEKIIEELVKNNSDKKFKCRAENIEYGDEGKVKSIKFE